MPTESMGVAKGYIELDVSRLNTSGQSAAATLASIERSAKLAQSQIDLLKTSSANSANAFDQARAKAAGLENELAATRSKADVFKFQMTALNTALETNKKAHSDLTAEIGKTEQAYYSSAGKTAELKMRYDEAKTAVKEVAKAYGEESEEAKKAAENAESLKSKWKESADETTKYKNEVYDLKLKQQDCADAISDTSAKLDEVTTDYNNTQSAVNKLSAELATTKSNLVAFGTDMQTVGTKLQTVGTTINDIGSKLSMTVTAPIVALGTAMAKSAMDAEDSYAKVWTIIDQSATSYEGMVSSVSKTSDELGISVGELNEALYQTISATSDSKNAFDYVSIAAKAAKGGFTDTATAVDGLTTVMNAYGLEGAESMQHVADVMLATQNYGKTTFGELAQAVGGVVATAAQAGVSVEELFTDFAVLTRNGVQTSKATTALKAVLSNLIKPTDQAAAAADALGINFGAAALQSEGLPGILNSIRESMANASPRYNELLTQYRDINAQMAVLEESGQKGSTAYKGLQATAKSLSEEMDTLLKADESNLAVYGDLFGSVEALNAVMVLTSDSGMAQFSEGLDQITNSTGATEKAFSTMQSTTGAKMDLMLNQLKNRGIEIGTTLLPYIVEVVDKIGDLIEKFDELDDGQKQQIIRLAGIAAAAGPVLKIVGNATTGIGKLTKGIGELIAEKGATTAAANAMGGAMGGIGTGAAGASGAVSSLSSVLGVVASPVGALALAAAAFGALAIATDHLWDTLVEDDIASKFGDIHLSGEEVAGIVERLTANTWEVKVTAKNDVKEKIAQIKKDLETEFENLNKLDWKISAGIELTAEEISAYKSSVESVISGTIAQMEQERYQANLTFDIALENATSDLSPITGKIDAYYTGLQDEFSKLGADWAALVNDALTDGIITDEEYKAIEQKEAELQKWLADREQAEYDIWLDGLHIEGHLDASSFGAIVTEAETRINSLIEQLEQEQYDAMVNARYMLNAGTITQEEYDALIKEIELSLNQSKAEVVLDVLDVEISELRTAYNLDESTIQGYRDGVKNLFDEILGDDLFEGGMLDGNVLQGRLSAMFDTLTAEEKEGLGKMLTIMEPTAKQLETIRDSYIEMGLTPPKAVTDGLTDYYALSAMTGDVDALYQLLASEAVADPETLDALCKAAEEVGGTLPAELVEVLEKNYGVVFDSSGKLVSKLSEGANWKHKTVESVFSALGSSIPQALLTAFASKSAQGQQTAMELLNKLMAGEKLKEPELRTAFATLGFNIPNDLIVAIGKQDAATQQAAVALLGQIASAEASERPGLIAQFKQLGIDLPDELVKGLESNGVINDAYTAGKTAGSNYAKGAQDGAAGKSVTVDAYLNASVSMPDGAAQARAWRKAAQEALDAGQLLAGVSIYGNGHHYVYAEGGFVDGPRTALIGEAGPEVVIPLSVGKRDRAMSLFQETASILMGRSYTTPDDALDLAPSSTGIDYNALAGAVINALKSAPITPIVNVEMQDGDVYMDAELVGRKTAPVVSRLQGR